MQDTAGNVGSATRELPAITPPASTPANPPSQPLANPTSFQTASQGSTPAGASGSAWDNNRSTGTSFPARTDALPPSAPVPAAAYQQPSTTYQQPAASYQQPVASSYQQPISNYQQPVPSPSPELSNRLVASSENTRGP